MKNSGLINKIAVKLELSSSEAEDLLNLILDILCDQLTDNTNVSIDGFGVFSTQKQNEFITENVQTGERYLMPPEVIIDFETSTDTQFFFDTETIKDFDLIFEPDDSLKKRVNNAFQHFVPTIINKGVKFPGIEVVRIGEDVVGSETVDESEPGFDSDLILEHTELESGTEINTGSVTDNKLVSNITEKLPPPKILEPDSVATAEKKRKSTSIWVPVLGGFAIAVAALFFFNRRTNQ